MSWLWTFWYPSGVVLELFRGAPPTPDQILTFMECQRRGELDDWCAERIAA